MKPLRCFSLFAPALALALIPSLARADEPSLATQVHRRVTADLVKPLADMENHRSRFSRMRQAPHERRVRVTQVSPTLDKAGRPFMAFAVDVKFGDEWRENDIVGCAYMKTRDLFVKRGDSYRPASFLLGKSADPVSDVCRAAPAPRA